VSGTSRTAVTTVNSCSSSLVIVKTTCAGCFEARKRYGLCLLNCMITSNFEHLLNLDGGNDVIARSVQLAVGRTAATTKYSTRYLLIDLGILASLVRFFIYVGPHRTHCA
jgi:hypothetical protein